MLKKIVSLVIMAVAVLLIPHLVRFAYFDNYMLGDTPYFHARIAQQVLDEGFVTIDSLDGSIVEFNAYHYILAAVGSIIGVLTATNFLPFIVGLVSIVLLYMILRKFQVEYAFIICIFTIISPLFIYTFTVSNPMAIVVLINLAGIYLLSVRPWTSVFAFAFIPFFGLVNTIVSTVLVLAYCHKFKIKKCGVIISVLLLGTIASVFIVRPVLQISSGNLPQDNLVDLGATLGFNLFALLLAGAGLIKVWKQKRQPRILLLMIILGLASFADSDMKILLNLIIAPFSAIGFIALYKMKWELRLVRNLTVLILTFALIFTVISYIHRISFMEPDMDTIDALVWLNQNSIPGEKVLSHQENGFFIEFFSNRPTIVDARSINDDLSNKTTTLYQTRNEETAESELDHLDITYIFVDDKTRQLMIKENLVGLEFLMENSESFELVYDQKVEIWKFN